MCWAFRELKWVYTLSKTVVLWCGRWWWQKCMQNVVGGSSDVGEQFIISWVAEVLERMRVRLPRRCPQVRPNSSTQNSIDTLSVGKGRLVKIYYTTDVCSKRHTTIPYGFYSVWVTLWPQSENFNDTSEAPMDRWKGGSWLHISMCLIFVKG